MPFPRMLPLPHAKYTNFLAYSAQWRREASEVLPAVTIGVLRLCFFSKITTQPREIPSLKLFD